MHTCMLYCPLAWRSPFSRLSVCTRVLSIRALTAAESCAPSSALPSLSQYQQAGGSRSAVEARKLDPTFRERSWKWGGRG